MNDVCVLCGLPQPHLNRDGECDECVENADHLLDA